MHLVGKQHVFCGSTTFAVSLWGLTKLLKLLDSWVEQSRYGSPLSQSGRLDGDQFLPCTSGKLGVGFSVSLNVRHSCLFSSVLQAWSSARRAASESDTEVCPLCFHALLYTLWKWLLPLLLTLLDLVSTSFLSPTNSHTCTFKFKVLIRNANEIKCIWHFWGATFSCHTSTELSLPNACIPSCSWFPDVAGHWIQ